MCHKCKGVLIPLPDYQPQITDLERRPIGGVWVSGHIGGNRFQALVYSEHASNPVWELGRSRISKLWVQQLESRQTVYSWDRGLDIPAVTQAVNQIVDCLTEFLAPHVFGSPIEKDKGEG